MKIHLHWENQKNSLNVSICTADLIHLANTATPGLTVSFTENPCMTNAFVFARLAFLHCENAYEIMCNYGGAC